MALGYRPPASSPSPLSDGSSSYDSHDVSEPLSEHENAFLDHTKSLLDQEYDYQKQLISHYSQIRDHASHSPYPQEEAVNPDGTGQHIEPSWPRAYGNRRDNFRVPPRIYAGMDAIEKGYPQNAYAYQYPKSRRPLVDYVTNQWRTTAPSPPYTPTSPSAPSIVQIITAPRLRRYLLVIILIVLMPWSSWRWYGRPRWEEHKLLNDALDDKVRKGAAWYGLNLRPAFLDMIQFHTLDVSELPQEGGKRRLIFIGDVHGCNEELQALLTETKYNNHTDHIVFTGDLISKGPGSAQVVDFAVNNSASCVRGNHEDRIMLAYRDLNIHRASLPGPDEDKRDSEPKPPGPGDPELDELDEESFSHGDYVDRKFAKSLAPEQASYLISCPLILDVGYLPGLGRTTVVHAGLVPGVDLQNQDPMGVMNMRTVDLKTHVPSRSHSGTPWFKLWNKHQSLVPSKDRTTVIYGHDAKRGLQLNQYSKGLDTGCASGGKLTALVVSIEGEKEADQQTVSVSCENHGGKKGKGRGWDDLPFMEIQEDNHGGRGTGHFNR
ncbi:MAG: hypothetical protein LQ346_005141 [Caloplaca aetnensis]|nr:MAG: hypothetical protein LQ346_005141 [Caloplaca aetnensis]